MWQKINNYKFHLKDLKFMTWLFPHIHQANKNKYPKTRKLTSTVENLQFFCFKFYKIFFFKDYKNG